MVRGLVSQSVRVVPAIVKVGIALVPDICPERHIICYFTENPVPGRRIIRREFHVIPSVAGF